MSPKSIEMVKRLHEHPELLARVDMLLNIVEDTGNDLKKAADAEMRVIEELRKMGNEVLTGWAKKQSNNAINAADKNPNMRRMGKKTSTGTAVTEK